MIEQKAYLDVVGILEEAGVGRGHYVGDLGCGSGYFTVPAAKMVGAAGRVFAVDVQKPILENIKSRKRMEGLENIVPVWTDLEIVGAAKQIGDESLDFAFLVNIFFQTKKDKEVLQEATRMTKPNGKILVVDWKKEVTPFGPDLDHRIEPADLKSIADSLGLTLDREFEAGTYHWGMILIK